MSEGTSPRLDLDEPVFMIQIHHRSYNFDASGVWGKVLNAESEDEARNVVVQEFATQGGNPVLIDEIEVTEMLKLGGES